MKNEITSHLLQHILDGLQGYLSRRKTSIRYKVTTENTKMEKLKIYKYILHSQKCGNNFLVNNSGNNFSQKRYLRAAGRDLAMRLRCTQGHAALHKFA